MHDSGPQQQGYSPSHTCMGIRNIALSSVRYVVGANAVSKKGSFAARQLAQHSTRPGCRAKWDSSLNNGPMDAAEEMHCANRTLVLSWARRALRAAQGR
jgi:hypothetical protein